MSGRAAKAARRAKPQPDAVPLVATHWANYRGDLSGAIGQVMGPTTHAPALVAVAVECDYDAETNRSRVGFVRRVMPVVRRG